jgi:flagellar hook-length control protein FliK
VSSSPNASTPASATTTIETPVHDPSWRFEAATRIASLVTRGVEHAEVRVTPPDLGPVELRIDVRGGEATLAIVATQPATRDALEQALPMLRDMLAQQGLSLGQATVADGRGESTSNGEASPVRADASTSDAVPEDAGAARAAHRGIARGLIDVFA